MREGYDCFRVQTSIYEIETVLPRRLQLWRESHPSAVITGRSQSHQENGEKISIVVTIFYESPTTAA